MAKRLDRAVKRHHERKLGDGYRFLFFDGVVLAEGGGEGSEEDHPKRLRGDVGREERDD